MNIEEYISGGIVESYVLGLADADERAEFERMCIEHPEVRAAREAFEMSLEEQALANPLQPPANLKSKIFSQIGMESGDGGTIVPPVVATGTAAYRSQPLGEARVVKMKTYGLPRFVAAAAIVLLLMSTALNFYFFNQYKEYYSQYQSLVQSQSELAANNQVLQTRLLDYEKAVEMMKNPDMAVVKMPAMPESPDPTSATMVFWDKVSKDVYLAVNKLPQPEQDKQYQLWAIVDGKPVDAGVFEMKEGPGMMKMKNIPRAEAFAITLEKRGGSPVPTSKLYVMGKV